MYVTSHDSGAVRVDNINFYDDSTAVCSLDNLTAPPPLVECPLTGSLGSLSSHPVAICRNLKTRFSLIYGPKSVLDLFPFLFRCHLNPENKQMYKSSKRLVYV